MVQTKRSSSNSGRSDDDSNDLVNTNTKMEKTLKIWQFAFGAVVFSITVISLIVNLSNKIETQRLRIEFLESAYRDHGILIRDMVQKNDLQYNDIRNTIADIRVMLQDKMDRSQKK